MPAPTKSRAWSPRDQRRAQRHPQIARPARRTSPPAPAYQPRSRRLVVAQEVQGASPAGVPPTAGVGCSAAIDRGRVHAVRAAARGAGVRRCATYFSASSSGCGVAETSLGRQAAAPRGCSAPPRHARAAPCRTRPAPRRRPARRSSPAPASPAARPRPGRAAPASRPGSAVPSGARKRKVDAARVLLAQPRQHIHQVEGLGAPDLQRARQHHLVQTGPRAMASSARSTRRLEGSAATIRASATARATGGGRPGGKGAARARSRERTTSSAPPLGAKAASRQRAALAPHEQLRQRPARRSRASATSPSDRRRRSRSASRRTRGPAWRATPRPATAAARAERAQPVGELARPGASKRRARRHPAHRLARHRPLPGPAKALRGCAPREWIHAGQAHHPGDPSLALAGLSGSSGHSHRTSGDAGDITLRLSSTRFGLYMHHGVQNR